MSDPVRLVRRNIHTYPFKYRHLDPAQFFAADKGVVYVHIPFCSTKCHFCDYAVYTNTAADLRRAYVDALCAEIARFPALGTFPRFNVDAIYFGGGTPGLLEGHELVRIAGAVRDTFPLTPACEIAVEFDPASISVEKLRALREAGFGRLSMGIQSFDEKILAQNNRPHNLEDCYRAWEAIRQSGFTHVNLDLIYPLLDLDLPTWERSIRTAVGMGPSCITAYPLEVWPDTAYHSWLSRNKRQLPPAAVETEMCRLALDVLEDAGYRRGSTSGYYHPDRAPRYCRFLEYYWRTWPMIGFGISSKSVIYDRLYTNIRSIKEYLRRIDAGESVVDFGTRISKRQEMRRVMIRGLKMCEVFKQEFLDRFGIEMEAVFGRELRDIIDRGFVVDEGDRISLTREGQVFATNAWEVFYTEDDVRPPREDEVQFGLSELVVN